MDMARYLRGRCAVAALAVTMSAVAGIAIVTTPTVGGASARGSHVRTSAVSGDDHDSDLTVSVPSLSATVGTPISQTVATFADPPDTDLSTAYTASIDWGDGTVATSGSISQPGGSGTDYAVDGSHTYTAAGPYTVTVTEPRSADLETGTGTGTASVAGQVITCSGSSCSGSVTSGPETLALKAQSSTGSVTIALADGSLTCSGTYRHAPLIATEIPNGVNPGKPIHVKVTFPRSDLAGTTGPVEVCYQSTSNHTFVDINGQTVTPGNVGLLPLCASLPGKPKLGPCLVRAVSTAHLTINEMLLIPPGDPSHN